MNYQKRFTSSGKLIEIYDDIFTSGEKIKHLTHAQYCPYVLGYPTSNIFWQKSDTFFFHLIDDQEMLNFGFTESKFYKNIILKRLPSYRIERSWFLSSSPFSTYYYHVDNSDENNVNRKTLLYYLNSRWDRDWGGETLFANDQGECEIAVEYRSGRVVLFDGSIEHKPSAISMKADEFRFIFVIQFVEIK